MSTVSREPQADPLYARPLPERPAYATGMLLGARDFVTEQTYHRGRLARALAQLSGNGTLAGLAVVHQPATATQVEEIRVEPGVAVDRLGRLIEITRPACVRLQPWFAAEQQRSDGAIVLQATYTSLNRFLSTRRAARAGAGEPAIPTRAVVADVYLRFVACETALAPAFAGGPYDAIDAAATARLRDAYELHLVPRRGLGDGVLGLPSPNPTLWTLADLDQRRDALQDAVLAGYPADARAGTAEALAPLPEHAEGVDASAVFLARVLIPVGPGDPPARIDTPVVVDNWVRRFLPSVDLLARWVDAARP